MSYQDIHWGYPSVREAIGVFYRPSRLGWNYWVSYQDTRSGVVLSRCRDAVGVFYNPCRLGHTIPDLRVPVSNDNEGMNPHSHRSRTHTGVSSKEMPPVLFFRPTLSDNGVGGIATEVRIYSYGTITPHPDPMEQQFGEMSTVTKTCVDEFLHPKNKAPIHSSIFTNICGEPTVGVSN